MPAGVEVLVEDGFATIAFVDPSLRGPGLAKLLEKTPPEFIEKLTRPRVSYRVPEGNAREAGLLDDPAADDEPSEQWHRPELNAAAAEVGVEEPEKLPNKAAVLDAYREAKAKQ